MERIAAQSTQHFSSEARSSPLTWRSDLASTITFWPPSPPPSPTTEDVDASTTAEDGTETAERSLVLVRGPGVNDTMINYGGAVYTKPDMFPLDVEGLHERMDSMLNRERNQTAAIAGLQKAVTKANAAVKAGVVDYRIVRGQAADLAVKVLNAELAVAVANESLAKEVQRKREASTERDKVEEMLCEMQPTLERLRGERDAAVTKL